MQRGMGFATNAHQPYAGEVWDLQLTPTQFGSTPNKSMDPWNPLVASQPEGHLACKLPGLALAGCAKRKQFEFLYTRRSPEHKARADSGAEAVSFRSIEFQ